MLSGATRHTPVTHLLRGEETGMVLPVTNYHTCTGAALLQ